MVMMAGFEMPGFQCIVFLKRQFKLFIVTLILQVGEAQRTQDLLGFSTMNIRLICP